MTGSEEESDVVRANEPLKPVGKERMDGHQANRDHGYGITSMITGIVSVVFCWIFFIGIPTGIVAIVFANIVRGSKQVLPRTDSNMVTTGLITGIVGTALSVIILIWFVAAG